VLIAGSCVSDGYEPRQVREEAAVVTQSGVAVNLAITSGYGVTGGFHLSPLSWHAFNPLS